MCFNGGKELEVRAAPEMRTVCGLAASTCHGSWAPKTLRGLKWSLCADSYDFFIFGIFMQI